MIVNNAHLDNRVTPIVDLKRVEKNHVVNCGLNYILHYCPMHKISPLLRLEALFLLGRNKSFPPPCISMFTLAILGWIRILFGTGNKSPWNLC
jgi:hypothetical protein